MSNLDELFCHVDDWAQTFEPLFQKQLLSSGVGKRIRAKSLCLSESDDHFDCFSSKQLS